MLHSREAGIGRKKEEKGPGNNSNTPAPTRPKQTSVLAFRSLLLGIPVNVVLATN